MKITKENLQLSGKGATVSQELLHDNIKIVTEDTQFHEVVTVDNDETTRVGWLVPNTFEIFADFTTHSENGMRGKSTHDTVKEAFLIDGDSLLKQILPEELVDVDVTGSQEILDRMLSDDKMFQGDVRFENLDEKEGLIILSPASKLVFVQSDKNSVRISSPDGVYVLKRGVGKDKLVIIDHNDGVSVWGDKNIRVGPGGIVIDGKPLNVQAIVNNAMASIGPALAGLGALGAGFNAFDSFDFNFDGDFDFDINMDKFERKMEKFGKKMEKMGEKMAKQFGKNFHKNFSINFGEGFMDDFDDDFDNDFSDAHDVDVDF